MLRFIPRALLNYPRLDLVFLERFKVKANHKQNYTEFEYYGILKIKIPRGFTVSAQMVKGEIEIRMNALIELLAHACMIHQPEFRHRFLDKQTKQIPFDEPEEKQKDLS